MDIEEFIDKCIKEKQYFGLGNPNSKMLFIGKEAGVNHEEELTHGTGLSWKRNGDMYTKRFIPEDEKLLEGRHTWQKYQRLFELIMKKACIDIPDKTDKHEITFVEYLFTTELSNLNAKNSSTAKKIENFKTAMDNRKKLFWRSNFIDGFDIVLIFASDNQYIETFPGEVQELFKVKFDNKDSFGKAQNLWIHHSDTSNNRRVPKLVIHTRQLTNGCSDEILEKIAELVSKHILKYNIEIKPAVNNNV